MAEALEFNRKGQWAKAAQAWLDGAGKNATAVQRCEGLVHLAYANDRLGRRELAQESVRRFDRDCGEAAVEPWLRAEMAKLRPSGQPRVQDDGFWQTADGAALGMDAGALAEHYRAPASAMSSTKARKRLFEPLGMKETALRLDQEHHAWTYADMETTPRDFARIGPLMLRKGMWEDRRIISAALIKAATSRSQDLNKGYGLLWWLYDKPAGFAALGYLDTNLYVFPKRDLIVVRMQRSPLANGENYEPKALPLFERMVKP